MKQTCIGYIIMSAPKKRLQNEEYFTPHAYGSDEKSGHDMLLTHRGATIFKTADAASKAMEKTCQTAVKEGHTWPRKNVYGVVAVWEPV